MRIVLSLVAALGIILATAWAVMGWVVTLQVCESIHQELRMSTVIKPQPLHQEKERKRP